MEKLTISSLLRKSIEKYSEKHALSFAGEEGISYFSLGIRIQNMSNTLDVSGIKHGDRVAILGENMPNWGVAYLSIVCLGAVVVPILPDFHENEVETILNHSDTKLIFASEKQVKRLKDLFPKLTIPVILLDNLTFQGNTQSNINDALSGRFFPGTQDVVNETDLASLIYTSGTTGSSKGVMLTHKNLAWMAIQTLTVQNVNETDRFLSILPMSHTYENTLGFLLPLFTGASVYYMRKHPTPSVLIEAMAIVKPTTLLTVPLIIEKIYSKQILPKFNSKAITRMMFRFRPTRILLNRLAGKKIMKTFGGQVRFFGIGGAKLDPVIEKYLREARFPYAIGYGLTETSPLLAGGAPFNTPYQSTGKPVQGVQIRLHNQNRLTGEGEIQAKGANVMSGYFKNPELTSQVFTEDGWFKTGDLGYMDKGGTLFIRGRIKNIIVGTNGENIYPEEIEAILNRIEYVEESLVVQEQGRIVALINLNLKDFEEKIVNLNERAVKVANESIDELLNEAQNFVNQRVNKFSRIQMVRLQPVPFEKTPTNKIKRYLYGD